MSEASLAPLAPPVAPLTIDEALVGRRTVLAVAGEIDINTTGALQAAIESAASCAFEIWLDLTDTTFMDSSGLHAIAAARTRLSDANRRLVVICPDGPVLRVLTLTGFDEILEIHPSRHEAASS